MGVPAMKRNQPVTPTGSCLLRDRTYVPTPMYRAEGYSQESTNLCLLEFGGTLKNQETGPPSCFKNSPELEHFNRQGKEKG